MMPSNHLADLTIDIGQRVRFNPYIVFLLTFS